ncbi:MAG TPA: FAD-linked oxidase C-terminal domain-containing protein, partial [Chitinivibrionales bacterium]
PDYPAHAHGAIYWEYMETTEPFERRYDAWEKALTQLRSGFDVTWSGFNKSEIDFLKWFRHSVPEMINAAVADYKRRCPDIRKISTDAALPKRFFAQTTEQCVDMVEKSKLHYVLFGHLGDFHLHCNLLPRTQAELTVALEVYENIMELVIARQGTVSAEHGIGKIKRAYLARQYGPAALMEMVRVKSHFDPLWLLNRGNLFDRLPQHIL